MPSQDEAFKNWDKYTTAPVLIFQIQSYAHLTSTESMLFNHVIHHSINVFGVKNSNARNWIAISPSTFSQDRGIARQGVQDALKKLTEYGFINSRETVIRTNSGHQKCREYCLISNKELHVLFDRLSSSANPRGAKRSLAPQKLNKVAGAKPSLAPCKALLGTLTGPAWHLVRPCLAPHGVISIESLRKITPKDSLNTFNNFLKTFSEFQNSYYELYSADVKSKSAVFKIEMKIHALIRRYGLYSTFTAMSAHLFVKDAQIGNFEALKAFLELNEAKLKEQEENFISHSDNLFGKILALHIETAENTELKVFRENFRTNASVLLLNVEFEASSNGIFFYNGFSDDVIRIFEECNYKHEKFTSEIISKLNLYFQSKILGMKGLNFVQSLEH